MDKYLERKIDNLKTLVEEVTDELTAIIDEKDSEIEILLNEKQELEEKIERLEDKSDHDAEIIITLSDRISDLENG